MTTDKEAERIAAGLTEAQRAWLLAAEPTTEYVPKEPCAEWWDSPERLYVKMDGRDHWLGSRSLHSPEGCSTFTSGEEKLTPLGLRVRTILQKGEPQ